jgi:hypothetical protein
VSQVVSMARKHVTSGISMLDLIQEENIGPLNAVADASERPIGDFIVLTPAMRGSHR